MSQKRNTFKVDEDLNEEFNVHQLKKLGAYIFKYKGTFAIAVIVILISSMASLITPLLMKNVIDDYIPNQLYRQLIISSGMFLIVIIISSICMKYRIRLMSKIGQNIIADMRSDLFAHIQKLPFDFFDSRPHGKILVRVVNYINALSDLLSNGFINLIMDLFSFAFATVIMAILDYRLLLLVIVFIPFVSFGLFLVKRKQRKAFKLMSSKQSNLNAYIHESISGMKVTQSFTREEMNDEIFNDLMDEYQENWLIAKRYMLLVFPIVKNAAVISQAVVLATSLFVFKDIKPGVVIAMLGYSGNFWQPIINISDIYAQLVSASAYIERIFETLDEDPNIKDSENAYDLPEIKGEVSFENVTFAYNPKQVILEKFDLKVKAGETIALVGPTGAGKSTIVNLMSRFYDVNDGEVLIDGHNVKDVKISSLRKQMGIMMQDTFIFSGSIRDNIRYGRLNATDHEIEEVSKIVKAHDFIVNFEEGYDTKVNERGTSLSVGQRQLISFARALLADPKILILDEATASIDTNTEKLVQEAIDKVIKGRTCFIIAHRLSTIKNADRILVINNKGIEEEGSHSELIMEKGHYFKLQQAQLKFIV